MPIHLNVRQIREALHKEIGARSKLPEPSAQQRLAGRLFHECFAALILSLTEAPEHRPERWKADLLERELYERHFGPRLIEHQVHFRNDTRCVRDFWTACRNMCAWLAGLMESAASNRVELLFHPEEAFSMELASPHWSDTVVLSGVADLVVRFQTLPHWCLVELKFSRSLRDLDLAQACLYHMMARKAMPAPVGTLALVRFSPDLSETLFDEKDISRIHPRLIEWIGKLAGVRNARPQPSTPVHEPPDEKMEEQAKRIEEIFHEYGLQVSRGGEAISGPCFIRYPIRLGKGVKIGAVQKTAAEIQHRLGVDTPPYIHLSEGQVFVDLQRADRRIIAFRDVLGQLRKSGICRGCSKIMLGVDLFNRLHTADLSQPEHAHFLIAGTTGSGKTEWLRTALAGLIATNSPKTLRLVIIDPKRNGFSDLQGSPFLWNDSALVYPDEQSAADVLAALADEMDRRFRRFEQEVQVDHLDAFNQTVDPPLPRIICVCDEYADLVNRDREERKTIEARINRLGQKARSAGIHLLIATQHPSRQIVRGTLDANLPARIGFKMNRDIESKMVLNQRGAEHLLGAGDMLFKSIGEPKRLQAPLMRPEERARWFSGNFYRDKPDV